MREGKRGDGKRGREEGTNERRKEGVLRKETEQTKEPYFQRGKNWARRPV